MIESLLPAVGTLIAVTEAQQTERALTALIGLLLVVAAMLALLTIWYWRHTNPRRRYREVWADVDGYDGRGRRQVLPLPGDESHYGEVDPRI